MYLVTAYSKECSECLGRGHRADELDVKTGEPLPCPTCSGTTFEPVAHVVDGKLYLLPANEVVEIENKAHAENFIQQKHYRGVVEVKAVRIAGVPQFDVPAAIARSKDLIHRAYEERAAEYIRIQQEGPLAQGKPATPPFGIHKEAIEVLNIDLAKHNIKPPAYQLSERLATEKALQEQESNDLRADVRRLTALVETLMLEKSTGKPKGRAAA